jgi:hemerythrin-like domain-containing protein
LESGPLPPARYATRARFVRLFLRESHPQVVLITGLCEEATVNILDIIKKEHREAAALLDEALKLDPDDSRLADLAKEIEQALTTHVEIEERLFYARLRRDAGDQEERVDVFEAYTEHEVASHLIALLKSRRKRDERFKAEIQVLAESIKHHVKEEESTIFSLAKKLLDQPELDALGAKWEKARERLPATPAKSTRPGKKAA